MIWSFSEANCGLFRPWGFLLRQIKCTKCSLGSLSRVCSSIVCHWTALHHCNNYNYFSFLKSLSCLWFARQLQEKKNKQWTDRIIIKKTPGLWKNTSRSEWEGSAASFLWDGDTPTCLIPWNCTAEILNSLGFLESFVVRFSLLVPSADSGDTFQQTWYFSAAPWFWFH